MLFHPAEHKAKGECDSEATLTNAINVNAMERQM